MSDEGPLKGWGKDGVTEAPVITAAEQKLRGKFKPPAYIPTSEESLQKEQVLLEGGDELDAAFTTIKNYLARGHKFKTAHKETAAYIIQTDLSTEQIAWQDEISKTMFKRPLHQCYNGWWQLCNDNGLAQAPHFDVAWSQKTEFDPTTSTCTFCDAQFTPEKYGQKFCSKHCGAKSDKKKLEAMIAARPGERPQAATGE